MYYLPQEIEAWYIIPAIRREVSKCMIREHGISYEKTGNILGVSKAAISQYLKGKRAGKIKLPKELNSKISASCKLFAKDKTTAVREINMMLDFIRKKSLACCVCEEIKDGVLNKCKEVKFVGENYIAR
jgi:predicted transcriptional regulator